VSQCFEGLSVKFSVSQTFSTLLLLLILRLFIGVFCRSLYVLEFIKNKLTLPVCEEKVIEGKNDRQIKY
jgi:hypothetical protein